MSRIFLIRNDDGIIYTASTLISEWFQAANDGELDIIDITDPNEPRFYFGEGWIKIDKEYH